MLKKGLAVAALGAAICSGSAMAGMMHPQLTAKLSGMGMHGTVNLTSNMTKHELCWSFDAMGATFTGASVRDSAGMTVAALGTGYKAKGCAMVSSKALGLIETKPGSYQVWLDTKGNPGDLRGKLSAGMSHM